MSDWREPITDRTLTDVKNADTGSLEYQKGTLNADDLNRIEDNYKYLMAKLKSDAIFIPHRLRNFTETVLEYVEKNNGALPEGYTKLVYIESSGTQYIDTLCSVSNNTRIVSKHQLISGNPYPTLFGVTDSKSLQTNDIIYVVLDTLQTAVPYWGNAYKTTSVNASGVKTIDVNKNVMSLDGTTFATFATTTFTSANSLFLFAYNEAGSVANLTSARIYDLQIYDNGVLVRDFIPCVNADGTAGLYDLVGAKFYENAGSGKFFYQMAVELPSGYTQREYIQSSGTQCIDTGIKPNQNTRVVAEMSYVAHSNTACGLMGSRSYKQPSNAFELYYYGTDWCFAFCLTDNNFVGHVANGAKMYIDLSKESASITTNGAVDNGTPASSEAFSGEDTIAIHALHRSGAYEFKSVSRTYWFKIYDNGTLVRDYVPCTDITGVAGLYDLVEGKFYGNAGTGVFAVGAEIEKLEPEISYELIETITTYTDWRENNLPWLSEINRIRANYNALVRLFLVGLGFHEMSESNYLDYIEVNNWEKFALFGKMMFENMEKEYRYCGVEESGGDRLL